MLQDKHMNRNVINTDSARSEQMVDIVDQTEDITGIKHLKSKEIQQLLKCSSRFFLTNLGVC